MRLINSLVGASVVASHVVALKQQQGKTEQSSVSVASKAYTCEDNGACRIHKLPPGDASSSDPRYTGQSTCLATCGGGSIWPYPTGSAHLPSSSWTAVDGDRISMQWMCSGYEALSPAQQSGISALHAAAEAHFRDVIEMQRSYYMSSSEKKQGQSTGGSGGVTVILDIADPSVQVASLDVDESYSLSIQCDGSITSKTYASRRGSDVPSHAVVKIAASSFFGARHGLETLSQLLNWDDFLNTYTIACGVEINNDAPQFPYRGVMMDLSRSFFPIDDIKRTIRAMGYNKLNVLHLHVSDTASFPVALTRQPNVTHYGAYSDAEVYSTYDLAEIERYANSFGVMVLPEIDGPAHVASGFEWGAEMPEVGPLVLCTDEDGSRGADWLTSGLGPPTGQLNLANENVYRVMDDVYSELMRVAFPMTSYFHVGGDEIIVGTDDTDIVCYNSTTKAAPIIDMLASLGLDRNDRETFYALWQNYTYKVSDLVAKAFDQPSSSSSSVATAVSRVLKKLFIWGGAGDDATGMKYNLMTREDVTKVLPPSLYNIHVWDEVSGSIVPELLQKGYSVVLANTDYVYLDCGSAGWAHPGGYWCPTYHEWQKIYNYIEDAFTAWGMDPSAPSSGKGGILGSQTLAWSEVINSDNLDLKLWPRSAALAEALWGRSSPSREAKTSSWYTADPRMQRWRDVMVQRGIHVEPLQTRWCQQREAYACSINSGTPQ